MADPLSHRRSLRLCGGNYPRWISLYFFRGSQLDDPDGVLEESGKLMRQIKMREASYASRPKVNRLVRRAFKTDGARRRTATR